MTPVEASRIAREICEIAPVIPVLVLDDVAHARPLAEALVAGGLPVLEVTLRTPVARCGTAPASRKPPRPSGSRC